MDNNYLADLLYPDITTYPADMENRYPPRNLPEGTKVTRFAPSPTGFVHFGGLFPTRVSERLAHQSGGVFILRIEDTDNKREVEGAEENLINIYEKFQIFFDEGAVIGGDKGDYGPYRQSERKEIYQTYAKQLVREGKAYPCFCTEEELEAIRAEQEELKVDPGYYGKWAIYRDADISLIEEKLSAGLPFVLRFRSEGNVENKIKFTDLIKGTIEVTENDKDHVLLKSNGIPTYHFAHAVDDHLMGTTHVVRGEEWLPSLPFHIDLFRALGFKLPKFLHISQLMKLDENGAKKKLSKRDNGVDMRYYLEKGYAPECVAEYIMTLLNSNYEEWHTANPDAPFTDFPFSIKKMSPSGSLFDLDKFNDVSKNIVARMSASTVYDYVYEWAKTFDTDFAEKLSDREYAERILSIGRGGAKPRKDFAIWSEVKPYMSLFYDDYFAVSDPYPENFDKAVIKTALEKFLESYCFTDDSSAWFEKMKDVSEAIGFARETKLFKKEPDKYPGHVGDVSSFVRIAVTGKQNSPDLYEVMQILGEDRVRARISDQISAL